MAVYCRGIAFLCFFGVAMSMYACRITTKGVEYSGTLNQTISGLDCQRWDSQYPHPHSYTEAFRFAENDLTSAENFCRNPSDEEMEPWCYTTDTSVEKEICNVPFCAPYQEQCKTEEGKGLEYIGQVNYTVSGRICQHWSQSSPHKPHHTVLSYFAGQVASLADIKNFCRGYDSDPRPWCYTLDSNKRWELCEVPYCSDGPGINEIHINRELQKDQTLVDGNFSTCNSFAFDNFRLQLQTLSPWQNLAVEFAYNSYTLVDCASSGFLAYFSSSQDTCGPVIPCQWQSVYSTIDEKFCRFLCSCDTVYCQSLTLSHHLLPQDFQLCELKVW